MSNIWQNISQGAEKAFESYEPETEAQRNNRDANLSAQAIALQNHKELINERHKDAEQKRIDAQQKANFEREKFNARTDYLNKSLEMRQQQTNKSKPETLKSATEQEYLNFKNEMNNIRTPKEQLDYANKFLSKNNIPHILNLTKQIKNKNGQIETINDKRELTTDNIDEILRGFLNSGYGKKLAQNNNEFATNKARGGIASWKNALPFQDEVVIDNKTGKTIDLSDPAQYLSNIDKISQSKQFKNFVIKTYGINPEKNPEFVRALSDRYNVVSSLAPNLLHIMGETTSDAKMKNVSNAISRGILNGTLGEVMMRAANGSFFGEQSPYQEQNSNVPQNPDELMEQLNAENQVQAQDNAAIADIEPVGDSGQEGNPNQITPDQENQADADIANAEVNNNQSPQETNSSFLNEANATEIPNKSPVNQAEQQEIKKLAPITEDEREALNESQNSGWTIADVATRPIRDTIGLMAKVSGKVFKPIYRGVDNIIDQVTGGNITKDQLSNIPADASPEEIQQTLDKANEMTSIIPKETREKLDELMQKPEIIGDLVESYGRTKGGDDFMEDHPVTSFVLGAIPLFTPAGAIFRPFELAGEGVSAITGASNLAKTTGYGKIIEGAIKGTMFGASLKTANILGNTKWDASLINNVSEGLKDYFTSSDALINGAIGFAGGVVSDTFRRQEVEAQKEFGNAINKETTEFEATKQKDIANSEKELNEIDTQKKKQEENIEKDIVVQTKEQNKNLAKSENALAEQEKTLDSLDKTKQKDLAEQEKTLDSLDKTKQKEQEKEVLNKSKGQFNKMSDEELVGSLKSKAKEYEAKTEKVYQDIQKDSKELKDEDKNQLDSRAQEIKSTQIIPKTDKELLDEYITGKTEERPQEKVIEDFIKKLNKAKNTGDLMKLIQDDINDKYGTEKYDLLREFKEPIGQIIDEYHNGAYEEANKNYENWLNFKKSTGLDKVRTDRTEGKKPKTSELINKSTLDTMNRNFDNPENQQLLRSGALLSPEDAVRYIDSRISKALEGKNNIEDMAEALEKVSNAFDPIIQSNSSLANKINSTKELLRSGAKAIAENNQMLDGLNKHPDVILSENPNTITKELFEKALNSQKIQNLIKEMEETKGIDNKLKLFNEVDLLLKSATHLFDNKKTKIFEGLSNHMQDKLGDIKILGELEKEIKGYDPEMSEKILSKIKDNVKELNEFSKKFEEKTKDLENIKGRQPEIDISKIIEETVNDLAENKKMHYASSKGIWATLLKFVTRNFYDMLTDGYIKPALKSDLLMKHLGEAKYKEFMDLQTYGYKMKAAFASSINFANYLRAMMGAKILQDVPLGEDEESEIQELGRRVD